MLHRALLDPSTHICLWIKAPLLVASAIPGLLYYCTLQQAGAAMFRKGHAYMHTCIHFERKFLLSISSFFDF